jgi:hypothetical protein
MPARQFQDWDGGTPTWMTEIVLVMARLDGLRSGQITAQISGISC